MTAFLIADARLITDVQSPVDILIEDGLISSIGPAGSFPGHSGQIFDAGGDIAMPGLINAHLHSHELLMKGIVWGYPLELYMPRHLPRYEPHTLPSPEDIYYRTLAACLEMLGGGITAAADDVIHPSLDDERIDAVLQAYVDSGMRARVSVLVENVQFLDTIPGLREVVPADLAAMVDRALPSDASQMAAVRGALDRWSSRGDGRVGVMVSPSAPQRCTRTFLVGLGHLSAEYSVPLHVHVQETLTQAATGPLFYGQSMIGYLGSLGLLGPRTTVAHGVWLSADDIRLIADAGSTVVHNPVSNMKLGSGVARVRDLLEAGVNVALGCDGYTCNDSQDMFAAMKAACLLSCIASTAYGRWLGPGDAIRMATVNGAHANGWRTGNLDPNTAADIILLDAQATAFVPLNDALTQTVFSAHATDVRAVFVAGRLVMNNGRSTLVDEKVVHQRVRDAAKTYWSTAGATLASNAELEPYVAAAYGEALRHLSTDEVYRLVPDQEWKVVRRTSD